MLDAMHIRRTVMRCLMLSIFFVCFAEWDGESAFSKSKKDTKCLYRCSFLFCDFIAIFVSVFLLKLFWEDVGEERCNSN